MKVFQELGQNLEAAWQTQNYAEDTFPDLAAQALADANLPQKVGLMDIVRWVHTEPQLPAQQDLDGRFGDPPVTLFRGPRFYIDIYFWLDGTTDIHQHSFAGAFQLLAGSSIHSRYGFRLHRAINERFLLGDVVFKDIELLGVGDVRQIIATKEHIHSVFHLDRPSATLTIRTYHIASASPQYSYRKPHLAFDPFYKEQSLTKKLQTVAMVVNSQNDWDALVGDLVSSSDFQTTFHVLQIVRKALTENELEKLFKVGTSQERFAKLLARAQQRHGDLMKYVMPVLDEAERLDDIARRRKFIANAEHRFFLALLSNVPGRKQLLELVQQRCPEADPVEKVLGWVRELSETKVWGSSEPHVLGHSAFGADELFVLECLLRDFNATQIETLLARSYPPDQARVLKQSFDGIARDLRSSTILKSLLSY